MNEAESHLQAAVAAAPMILFALDRHGIFTVCAGKALELLSLAPDDVVGRPALDVSALPVIDAYRRALSGESFTTTLEIAAVVFETSYAPTHDADGRVTGVVGVATNVTERKRVEAVIHDESEAAQALARIGQEVNSRLETPLLLRRLCELTTEVLGCDSSHMWLCRPDDGLFLPVAGFGDREGEWEGIRQMAIHRSACPHWFARLEREAVLQEGAQPSTEQPFRDWVRRYRMTARMYLPLFRGQRMIGFHSAEYRGRSTPFTMKQQQIGIAVAHLASVAVENARLVDELGQTNRFKSDMVAIIAHELRTPLNAIMGYTDLLLEGEFGALTAEQMEISRRVDRSAQVLRDLVAGTLELSRLDSGQLPLTLTDCDVSDLMDEINAEMREQHTKSGVTFRWQTSAHLPRLCSDPLKIKVILKNLIANAVKFTQRGEICVSAAALPYGVMLTVSDTGIGIGAEILPHIFEPFRQGEQHAARRFGGVGLGLYLVHRLVEVLGGTVEVESARGRGSLFRVWLPLVHPARQAPAARTHDAA
jgi:PAS domain S-box-containing protein